MMLIVSTGNLKIGEEKAMKVLVCVKRVIDYNVKVRVKLDRSGVDLANTKISVPSRHIALTAVACHCSSQGPCLAI